MKRLLTALLLTFMLVSPAEAGISSGLEINTPAPDFEGVNYRGEKIRLSDYYDYGPVVLLFYRGGWCPYCNMQLKDYQSHLREFERMSVQIIAVSVDTQEQAKKTAYDQDIGFEIISNPETDLLAKYKLIYPISDELYAKYKNDYKFDLEKYSGKTHHIIAVPATYIIDQSGNIVFAYVNEDYKVRVKAEEVLWILKDLLPQK